MIMSTGTAKPIPAKASLGLKIGYGTSIGFSEKKSRLVALLMIEDGDTPPLRRRRRPSHDFHEGLPVSFNQVRSEYDLHITRFTRHASVRLLVLRCYCFRSCFKSSSDTLTTMPLSASM